MSSGYYPLHIHNVSEGKTLYLCFSKKQPKGNNLRINKICCVVWSQLFTYAEHWQMMATHVHTETQWAWQPWVRRGKNDVHRKFACSSFSNYLLLILFVSYISIFLSSLFALQFGLDILFSRWPALTLRDLMGKVNLFVECVDQLKFWFLFQTSRKSYF